MLQLCKRALRPFTAATVAGVTMAMVLASSGAAGAGAVQSAPQPSQVAASAAMPATGTVLSKGALSATSRVFGATLNGTKAVRGTFTPISSRISDTGKLVLRGTLRAVVIDKTTGVRTKVTKAVNTLPVRSVNGNSLSSAARSAAPSASAAAAALPACQILNLRLGPVDLNLLGLEVHLRTVILNIVAVPGPGNLLGNLLCAVAHLLDGTPLGSQLSQLNELLASILAILRS